MYFKGTKQECQDIIDRLDSVAGYPNNNGTNTVSYNVLIPGTSNYLTKIPSDLLSELTDDEIAKTITQKPAAFDEQVD
tara:strand:- start:888 stop:1121 length:234 start_codon:yes stop_codon:yes gene_type:complete